MRYSTRFRWSSIANRPIFLLYGCAVAEPIVQAIVFFVSYRLVISLFGSVGLAEWSIVSALMALAQFGELGIARALPRYLAASSSIHSTRHHPATIVTTATVLATVQALIVAALLNILFPFVLSFSAIQPSNVVVQVAIISYFLSCIAAVPVAALQALGRPVVRVLIITVAELANLISVIYLLPRIGITSLAVGATIKWITILLAANTALFSVLPSSRWDWSLIAGSARELVLFGTKLQAINILGFLYEPVTKLLLGRLGATEYLASFEFITRVLQQGRACIVMGAYSLVPTLTRYFVSNSASLRSFFFRFQLYMVLLAVLFVFISILIMPYLLMLFPGLAVALTGNLTLVLAIAWGINLASVAAFMLGIASGRTKTNLVAHTIIAIGNICLGVLAMWYGSPFFIVLGWCISLSVGSAIIATTGPRMALARTDALPEAHP